MASWRRFFLGLLGSFTGDFFFFPLQRRAIAQQKQLLQHFFNSDSPVTVFIVERMHIKMSRNPPTMIASQYAHVGSPHKNPTTEEQKGCGSGGASFTLHSMRSIKSTSSTRTTRMAPRYALTRSEKPTRPLHVRRPLAAMCARTRLEGHRCAHLLAFPTPPDWQRVRSLPSQPFGNSRMKSACVDGSVSTTTTLTFPDIADTHREGACNGNHDMIARVNLET